MASTSTPGLPARLAHRRRPWRTGKYGDTVHGALTDLEQRLGRG